MKQKTGRTVKCYAYYDTPSSGENRSCSPAAVTKMDYILETLTQLGCPVELLSASHTRGKADVRGSTRALRENVTLRVLPAMGRGGFLRNSLGMLLFRLTRLAALLSFVNRGDTLLVYHSLHLMEDVRLLCRLKKVRLILEVEEIYSDVTQDRRKREKELRFFRLADCLVVPSEQLHRQICPEMPAAVAHGSYSLPELLEDSFQDGQIHLVYSGTLDPRKGGADAAVKAAAYLPEDYHLHILGFGGREEKDALNRLIAEISRKTRAKITYDGVLSGGQYNAFLQKCRIGLSTQNPAGAYNETSFPSKILAYLTNGLQVVTVRLPVVEQSGVGDMVCYYENQEPSEIAKAILSVDLSAENRARRRIRELHEAFREELKVFVYELDTE